MNELTLEQVRAYHNSCKPVRYVLVEIQDKEMLEKERAKRNITKVKKDGLFKLVKR